MRKKTLALILVCILGLAITVCGTSSTIEDSNTEKIDSSEMDNNISVTVNESGEDAEKSKAQGVSIIGDNYEITRDIYGLVIERRMSSEYNYSDFETDHKGNIISAKVTGSNTHNMLYEYDDNNRLIKSTRGVK